MSDEEVNADKGGDITQFLKYDDSNGYMVVKVICLGDSAVGKSK